MSLNFKDGLENAIAVLATVEGEAWAKTQWREDGYTVATLYRAWQWWQKTFSEADIAMMPRELVCAKDVDLPGDQEIYGVGGYSRYIVTADGNISAIRRQMNEWRIPKAEAAGIEFT